MNITELRRNYHHRICSEIIRISEKKAIKGETKLYPNFADGDSKASTEISWGIVRRLGCNIPPGGIKGQTAGRLFEQINKEFFEITFGLLSHIRPGKWYYSTQFKISEFDQYEHLANLEKIIGDNSELASAMGKDYIIAPDIVIGRLPVSDMNINQRGVLVNVTDNIAKLTPLREDNVAGRPSLHASISCKWTIRSDRVQNSRTEALNLIRNRKGHLPHIVAVTAEPLLTRISALALGTGDLDCVYHFALPELKESVLEIKNEDQIEMFNMLVEGRRLRDISDLPFDLAI